MAISHETNERRCHFPFYRLFMSGGFLSPETRSLFFHVFNRWERPQPLFAAKAFSNTNDQESQTYTQAALDAPPSQNTGSVPTV